MKLAIFDFDGTLLMTDTLPALAREWTRQKLPRMNYMAMYASVMPLLLAYKIGLLTGERFKHLVITNFNRIYYKMTRQEITDFFERAYAGLSKLFNPMVVSELQTAVAEGYRCVLVSGAYTDLLQVIAKNLGFDLVIGCDMAFKEGIYNRRQKPAFVEGGEKLEQLKKAIKWESVDWQASRSYGNSYSDLEIMQIVGEPVAVNPEPILLAHALQHKWRILSV